MWICMQIMWLSWTRRDRCVHIWKISVCCRRDISDGNVLFAVWWFLNIYFVNCKTSWGSSWFYWFCKELTLMVAAELFKFVLIHIWIKKKIILCAAHWFYVYIYLFICVELLLVWHINYVLLWCVCFLFTLYCHCLPVFIFVFLEQYVAYTLCARWLLLPCVVMVSGGLWYFVQFRNSGFPLAGCLRDFQWRY